MNTKERGDIAVGQAIAYYLGSGYEVCLPVGDKRSYDFVIEKSGKIERVQVKYAGFYKSKNRCAAGLRITGGNQSYSYAKKYGKNDFEILFVYTERGGKYHIPWKSVECRNELAVDSPKYRRYAVV